jgi:mono/diheme cytochrome c family protein
MKLLPLLSLSSLLVFTTGCELRKAMYDQPKYKPLEESKFFADHRSSRELIPQTVAVGQLRENDHLYTGKVDGKDADSFPFAITEAVLERGRQRYDIYCMPCHGQGGHGDGMVVRRGYKAPPSYHQDRLRNAAPGYYYGVIANGFGVMASYADQIPVEDRWAIAAYIKALQLSQNATIDDVPEAERTKLTAK